MYVRQSAASVSNSLLINRIKREVSFFVQRLTRHFQPQSKPMSREAVIAHILRARGCHCLGQCPQCQHIIEDVLGK